MTHKKLCLYPGRLLYPDAGSSIYINKKLCLYPERLLYPDAGSSTYIDKQEIVFIPWKTALPRCWLVNSHQQEIVFIPWKIALPWCWLVNLHQQEIVFIPWKIALPWCWLVNLHWQARNTLIHHCNTKPILARILPTYWEFKINSVISFNYLISKEKRPLRSFKELVTKLSLIWISHKSWRVVWLK